MSDPSDFSYPNSLFWLSNTKLKSSVMNLSIEKLKAAAINSTWSCFKSNLLSEKFFESNHKFFVANVIKDDRLK